MSRRTIVFSATVGALVVGSVLAWPRIEFYMFTRHFWPIVKVDHLHNFVAVTKWSSDGLSLEDGRTVQLPGVHGLPTHSAALAEATKRGVEIDDEGRVWGLVRVHHWCGNDAVVEHIARVDLADMLAFLLVGEATTPFPKAVVLTRRPPPGGKFTEYGWDIGEFLMFDGFSKVK